jgi:hypothetical protein
MLPPNDDTQLLSDGLLLRTDGCKVRKIGSFVSILIHIFSKYGRTDINLQRGG